MTLEVVLPFLCTVIAEKKKKKNVHYSPINFIFGLHKQLKSEGETFESMGPGWSQWTLLNRTGSRLTVRHKNEPFWPPPMLSVHVFRLADWYTFAIYILQPYLSPFFSPPQAPATRNAYEGRSGQIVCKRVFVLRVICVFVKFDNVA